MPDETIEYPSGDGDGPYYQGAGGNAPPDGNFVVAETGAGTKLMQWDATAGEWVVRGPAEMSGNDVTGVGALDAQSVSTDNILANNVVVSQSTVEGLTEYEGSDVSVANGTTQEIFNVSTTVDVLTGIVMGGNAMNLRAEWEDGTTDIIKGFGTNRAETNDANIKYAAFAVPCIKDVSRLTFESQGADSVCGWYVLTI